MCMGGGPSLPPAPPPVPQPEDPAVKEKAKNAETAARNRKGFGSTIVNSGGGLGVQTQPQMQRKTLLGG